MSTRGNRFSAVEWEPTWGRGVRVTNDDSGPRLNTPEGQRKAYDDRFGLNGFRMAGAGSGFLPDTNTGALGTVARGRTPDQIQETMRTRAYANRQRADELNSMWAYGRTAGPLREMVSGGYTGPSRIANRKPATMIKPVVGRRRKIKSAVKPVIVKSRGVGASTMRIV